MGILQCDTADDFIIASGVSHSLEEFVATAFAEVGLESPCSLMWILTARRSARMTSHIQPASQRRRDASSVGAPKRHLPRSCRAWCAPNGWGQRQIVASWLGRLPGSTERRSMSVLRMPEYRDIVAAATIVLSTPIPATRRVMDALPDDPSPTVATSWRR